MSWKKRLLVIAAVLLLFLGDYLYWTAPISLGKQLPAKVWGKAQLWYYDDGLIDSTEIQVTEEDFGTIAAALENTRVTRRPRFQTMSQPWFYLVVQRPDGALVILTIVENGDIAVDPGTGGKQYYDSGEELYQVLLAYAS